VTKRVGIHEPDEGRDRLVMTEKYEHSKGAALADLRSALKLSTDLDAQVAERHRLDGTPDVLRYEWNLGSDGIRLRGRGS
jgi:hypothetical protein